MKFEDVLKKFLPTTVSPKSIESFAGNLEQIGKLLAVLLAIFYVVGLIIYGLYYSSLHVRSIELLKIRYLFIGFYYLAFLFLHLVYPNLWIKRFWVKVLYLLILATLIIVVLNYDLLHSLIRFLPLLSDDDEVQSSIRTILQYFFVLSICLFFATFLFGLVTNLENKVAGRFFVIYAFLAITFNYYIFATFLFSNIPEAIGGGQPPFVRIIFNNTPPVDITSQFKVGSEPTIQYFGELVYMDGDSVFLSVPGLFNNEVYEFQRSDIMVVGYSRSNEATMEVIKVQQEFFEQLSP